MRLSLAGVCTRLFKVTSIDYVPTVYRFVVMWLFCVRSLILADIMVAFVCVIQIQVFCPITKRALTPCVAYITVYGRGRGVPSM